MAILFYRMKCGERRGEMKKMNIHRKVKTKTQSKGEDNGKFGAEKMEMKKKNSLKINKKAE